MDKEVREMIEENKQEILEVCPNAGNYSGIYVLTRRVAYIGQAKNILNRLASHMSGYAIIDFSLRKRRLFSRENPAGWKIGIIPTPIEERDNEERKIIELYRNAEFFLYNKTGGGQDKGKEKIADYKPPKGYRDGLKQGYLNARRDIAKWAKWFNISYDETKKYPSAAYEKFMDFIDIPKKEDKEEDSNE